MKRLPTLAAVCLICSICAFAQGFGLRRIHTDVKNGSLELSLEFSEAVATLLTAGSSLDYTIVKTNGDRSPTTSVGPSIVDPGALKTLLFRVPIANLNEANEIEMTFQLKNADKVVYASPITTINVSYLSALQGAQSRSADCERQMAESQARIREQAGVIETLRNKAQAKRIIGIKPRFISDSRIIVDIDLDLPGKISAKITNPDIAPRTKSYATPSKTQTVVFEDLYPDKEYVLDADILDISTDQPMGIRISGGTDDRLKIKTKSARDSLKIVPEINPSSGKLVVKLTANQPGFVQVDYAEVLDENRALLGSVKHKGGITLDEAYRIPSGTALNEGADNQFILDDVAPGKKYLITIKAVDDYGRTPTALPSPTVTVPELRKALAFSPDVPISLEVQTLKGVVAKWSATVKPKAASLIVIFNSTISVTATADVKDNGAITATLQVDAMAKVVQQTQTDKVQPTLRLSMEDDTGKTVVQDLKVAFGLPTQAEVATAQAEVAKALAAPSLTKDQKASLNNQKASLKDLSDLVKASQNGNGKIDWGNLLKSGLSMLLKVVAG